VKLGFSSTKWCCEAALFFQLCYRNLEQNNEDLLTFVEISMHVLYPKEMASG